MTPGPGAGSAPTSRQSDRPRTVVVTGSASGIGARVRRCLEDQRTRVIGVDLHDAEVVADLADAPQRARMLEDVTRRSEGRLDGLVACAGLGPHVVPVERIALVNFYGAVATLDGMLPLLARGESPAAVVLASNAATLTPPHPQLLACLLSEDESTAVARAQALDGATVYAVSKLALVYAMRRRAAQWGARGVRCNAVAPGPVDTPLLAASRADPALGPLVDALPIPLRRRGAPEEIASAVDFLLDSANGYVHGAVLFVDGGSDAQLRPDRI